MSTIIISLVVAAVLFLAVRKLWKDKRAGKSLSAANARAARTAAPAIRSGRNERDFLYHPGKTTASQSVSRPLQMSHCLKKTAVQRLYNFCC